MMIIQALLGLVSFTTIAFALSERKAQVRSRNIFVGLALQFVLAIVFLKLPVIQDLFEFLNAFVLTLQRVTEKSTVFMFGFLAGGEPPFDVVSGRSNFIVAFRILPLVVVVSALSAVLFHLRILPAVIKLISRFVMKTMGTSGPLAFGAGASLFLGTIETPLIVRPYLEKMPRSDLFALLCCTMSTVSGTVLVLYSSVLAQILSNPTGHLVIASVISMPAALMLSGIIIPRSIDQSERGKTIDVPAEAESMMGALLKGTQDGVTMVISIVAVIIVFFSMIYLIDELLILIPLPWSGSPISDILSYLLGPFMWLLGLSWDSSFEAAKLMGTKITLNEFVAYLQLAKHPELFTGQERTILTYAFCSFANFASLGIILGGLSSMLPSRQRELVSLGWKSLIVGNLAPLMTACVIAILTSLL
jgi:concentrative nucleoside transporter, CNT family